MQIKKSKFLIGTLLSVVSVGVVGSVIGTYAWYTYNTKDTLIYHGIAAAENENLQFRLLGEDDSAWRTTISSGQLTTYAESKGFAGNSLRPVSFNSTQNNNVKLEPFVGHYTPYTAIPPTDEDETKPNYLQVTIEFKCVSVEATPQAIERDVYLSKLNVKATSEGKDITPALRMHFDDGTANLENKTLVAPGRNAGTMNVYGFYDMDGDGSIDHGYLDDPTYGIYVQDDGPDAVDVPYGNHTLRPTESWFGKSDILATFDSDNYATSGRKILTTSTSTINYNAVTMTIWLDGWDAECTNKNAKCEFDLDLQFHSAKIPA